ncbi:MAG: flavin reductase family protein [Bacteroidia bacterium]|jgi:flavin reductase (DIM6/NTAB) family NADH-FMN oxidoreductase RutF|nr:flavin reductase family protein [Bacteroidia bacterium]
MKTITPKELPLAEFHNALLTAIAPRPICFASTMDVDGNSNLSPFSFFNIFGSNPTTLIFSPARRVRDNTIKHTLENVIATKEVVINVVNYNMVQQMSLASCEYPKGVDEFVKAGFTPLASQKVKPFRVKESPVQFECKVREIIETGNEGGAGNLVIAEIILMHIDDSVLTIDGKIDQHKMDLVGRLGSDWYVRANGNALFEVTKPNKNLGMGVDNLPENIRLSKILTGNDLGMLANELTIPDADSVEIYKRMNKNLLEIHQRFADDSQKLQSELHRFAHYLLSESKVSEAWKVLLG